MDSEQSRIESSAAFWTLFICLAAEAAAASVCRLAVGSWGGAVVMSALLLGPLSLWIAGPIYKYFVRASQ